MLYALWPDLFVSCKPSTCSPLHTGERPLCKDLNYDTLQNTVPDRDSSFRFGCNTRQQQLTFCFLTVLCSSHASPQQGPYYVITQKARLPRQHDCRRLEGACGAAKVQARFAGHSAAACCAPRLPINALQLQIKCTASYCRLCHSAQRWYCFLWVTIQNDLLRLLCVTAICDSACLSQGREGRAESKLPELHGGMCARLKARAFLRTPAPKERAWPAWLPLSLCL